MRKNHFKIIGWTFSSKLDWGSYIILIAKITSKKIGALIRSVEFFSPEVALHLYKSTIWPCIEYCCHVQGCIYYLNPTSFFSVVILGIRNSIWE